MPLELPKDLNKMVENFGKLPGIGEKSALRLTLALLKWDKNSIRDFSSAVASICDISTCEQCGLFSDDLICSICRDPSRSQNKTLCVVESISDAFAIEKSNAFQGRYHVLGGVLNPLMAVGPDELTINQLLSRVDKDHIEELVLALNPSVEGDVTSSYIHDLMTGGVKVKKLGLGIPVGGSLEYLDALTINKALEYGKYY